MINDTIVAISSPEGSSMKSLVRLSGSAAFKIAEAIETLEYKIPYRIVLLKSPRTYTKEDMAEIYTIGSPHLLKLIVAKLIIAGARLAEAGEFTMRAFLNGRIDLLQAEAVLDIIKAQNDAQHRLALAQLGGVVSNKLQAIEEQLLNLCAEVEAAIDFIDQDIDVISAYTIASKVNDIKISLEELLNIASENTKMNSELKLLLYGATNSGKSTLFNRLAVNVQSITSNIEVTTRDIISGDCEIGGMKCEILDSAGIVETPNWLDEKTMQMTKKQLQEADLILFIVDITAKDKAATLYDQIRDKKHLVVLNKVDLVADKSRHKNIFGGRCVSISALYGNGLAELKEAIYKLISHPRQFYAGAITLNLRQKSCLYSALSALQMARKEADSLSNMELISFDLRDALNFIGMVTGKVTTGDILKRIFERFCIGK